MSALLAAGCAQRHRNEDVGEGEGEGEGGEGEGAVGEGEGEGEGNVVGDRFADVDQIAQAAFDGSGAGGLGLAIYDASDHKVFSKMYGDFTPSRQVAIASASKLVSGLVLLNLVEEGELSLDSTTGDVLGWTGPKGNITLRHLMSFTSGLRANPACVTQPGITLEDCVNQIGDSTLSAAPGQQFDYGPAHLHVAGRMAEVVTGSSWETLFRDTLADPLGLPDSVQYFTVPKEQLGTTNPRVAAGLRASMDDYAPLLALAFHEGTLGDVTVASPELFEEQAREPFPSVEIANSPMADAGFPEFRYGLASWLECDTPAEGCAVLSSPGAFGFTPWYDRDTGYYAIIGAEIDADPAAEGVVQFSVSLAQSLKDPIRNALAQP
ncbi:MAG TPA: serine hydrolase [Kofleriaceae bacterium]